MSTLTLLINHQAAYVDAGLRGVHLARGQAALGAHALLVARTNKTLHAKYVSDRRNNNW